MFSIYLIIRAFYLSFYKINPNYFHYFSFIISFLLANLQRSKKAFMLLEFFAETRLNNHSSMKCVVRKQFVANLVTEYPLIAN